MAENAYFNCSLFIELCDQRSKIREKFSKVEEELFRHMEGAFSLATHKLASNPATMDSAQALMMCWNALKTMKEEQKLLALTLDKLITYSMEIPTNWRLQNPLLSLRPLPPTQLDNEEKPKSKRRSKPYVRKPKKPAAPQPQLQVESVETLPDDAAAALDEILADIAVQEGFQSAQQMVV
jgi:hypothetical protein